MKLACLIITLLMSSSVFTADGVREINQLCVAQGCFAGDYAGLPVTITEPGSYRLTSTLEAPSTNSTVITVADDLANVTIDLNGFSIEGPIVCTQGQPLCGNLGGLGRGIGARNARNLAIHNGTINGVNSGIVVTGADSTVLIRDLHVRNSRTHGINIAEGYGIIRNVNTSNNGWHGVSAYLGRVALIDSIAQNNGYEGAGGVLCSGNAFSSNGYPIVAPEQACTAQFDTNICANAHC